MPLLTYARYQQLGGELAEAAFSPLEMRASKVVDALTHGRARRESPPREAVERAVFALVAAMHAEEGDEGREVTSLVNDGVSVTYAARGGSPSGRWARIAREYLVGEATADGTSLLYTGVEA